MTAECAHCFLRLLSFFAVDCPRIEAQVLQHVLVLARAPVVRESGLDTAGLLLTLFNTAIGVGVSVRVPFTSANVSLAGSVGKKEKAPDALPPYLHGRLASNANFINQSNTLTIWVAQGTAIFVVGHQEGAPALDLHLEAR